MMDWVCQSCRGFKQLEEENRSLKRRIADLSLDNHIFQDVLSKKFRLSIFRRAVVKPSWKIVPLNVLDANLIISGPALVL
jgi:hypothetical protein